MFEFSHANSEGCWCVAIHTYPRWDGIPVHGTISLRRYSFSDTFAFFVPGKMLLSPASLFFYRFLDREEAVNLMHPTNPGPFIYLSLVDPSFRGRTIRAQFYIYSARRLESSSRFSRKSLHPEIGLCIEQPTRSRNSSIDRSKWQCVSVFNARIRRVVRRKHFSRIFQRLIKRKRKRRERKKKKLRKSPRFESLILRTSYKQVTELW